MDVVGLQSHEKGSTSFKTSMRMNGGLMVKPWM